MPYTYREVEKRLSKLGYLIVRQNGSHVIFSNGINTLPVPNHGGKDISSGVESKIIKNLGLTKVEFKGLV